MGKLNKLLLITMFNRIFSLCLLLSICFASSAQQIPQSAYQDLAYRMIGPFRASRTVGGVGVPSQPNVFFMGVNNGGVWKTDDFGRTWNPIFDSAPTGSVGDIAVFAGDPDIIYVGSGEGLHRPDLGVGDGIFKTTDGGNTWNHVGLKDVQQVGRLVIHPSNPDIVFVAGLGHPYGANEQRGVFKTTDGGKTWNKVLYINHNTGAIQVEFDPNNPDIIFADMWEHQEGPWENAKFSGPNSGLYKSVDGGNTWRKLTRGLPTAADGLGRIGVGIARSNSNIMYATVDAGKGGGIYKSEDAGESWRLVNTQRRLWGRGGDFAEIKVHPKNPDRIYVGNVASYTSGDGGKTWMSLKGAPGGDDYHRIWINPDNPEIMLFVADQGAVVTVNGGRTWSSWYNQPTSQLYHVTTDNQFPYWVYGGQQESGAIGIASRGNGGQISFREFMGVGADEYAYIAPDPKDSDIIYGGRVMKFNKKTGQSQNVAPEALRSGKYRFVRTMPLLFHPADDNMLLFATNVLWKTMNGGQSWEIISPDLTYEQPEVPPSVGDFKTPEMETMDRRGVIYALGPSPLDVNTIWAGTDDGRVHVTTDGGKNWTEVTPPAMKSWEKVSQIDASHFYKDRAYIAINAIRRDDMTPYIYRTRDGGKTWKLITNGLNPNGPVNVVREDPKQRGLLYAGTEREVYFSVDDGDNWQSLRNNMPATSIRDLVIHDNDLVVGTHGRSIWILDDIAPLREMKERGKPRAYLFHPSDAIRVRDNMFSDTPLPPEEPTGENPPAGAIIDYHLAGDVSRVKLEILDEDNHVIRTFASNEMPEYVDTTALAHPTYWIKPRQRVGVSAGHHRLVWDLRHEPPAGARREFSIAAVYKRTPSGPQGPLVPPGKYYARLTVGGNVMARDFEVKPDPRVDISDKALQRQTELSMACYQAYHELEAIKSTINGLAGTTPERRALVGNGSVGNPDTMYGSIRHTPAGEETIVGLQHKFLFMMNLLQASDMAPTSQTEKAIETLNETLVAMKDRWEQMR
jgi:photosystem II stability/assembly factor-like uncharacterized protein